MPAPAYFATAAALRRWFEENRAGAQELWVGFHRKAQGGPTLSFPEAIDEALCVGWIDAGRKELDDRGYAVRFTPRKMRSSWSEGNVARVRELEAQGRMTPAGRKSFENREPEKALKVAVPVAAAPSARKASARPSKKSASKPRRKAATGRKPSARRRSR